MTIRLKDMRQDGEERINKELEVHCDQRCITKSNSLLDNGIQGSDQCSISLFPNKKTWVDRS